MRALPRRGATGDDFTTRPVFAATNFTFVEAASRTADFLAGAFAAGFAAVDALLASPFAAPAPYAFFAGAFAALPADAFFAGAFTAGAAFFAGDLAEVAAFAAGFLAAVAFPAVAFAAGFAAALVGAAAFFAGAFAAAGFAGATFFALVLLIDLVVAILSYRHPNISLISYQAI